LGAERERPAPAQSAGRRRRLQGEARAKSAVASIAALRRNARGPAFARSKLRLAGRAQRSGEDLPVLGRFEHRSKRLLPRRLFIGRVARFSGVAAAVVACSLAIGAFGYHRFARLPWIDALLNASMILTGMGPVDRMETVSGKLFASAYALFSGIAFVSMIGLIFLPLIHRFFHALHLELDEPRDAERGDRRS
jgi:hypothetical protein